MNSFRELSFLLVLTTICTLFMWTGHEVLGRMDDGGSELQGAVRSMLANLIQVSDQSIGLVRIPTPGVPGDVFYVKSDPKIWFRVEEGAGMWGPIRLCVGIDRRKNKLLGVRVLSQQETPGLGARISEKTFWQQFHGRSFSRDIQIVRTPIRQNEVDGVTGATISSKAVEKIVNKVLHDVRILLQGTQGDEN